MVSRSSRLAMVVLLVAIVTGGAAGTAAALREFGNNGGRTIESRITPVTISEPRGEFTIRCEVKVEGIMNNIEDIRKVAGSMAGIVDKFESRNCRSSLGGAATVTALVGVGPENWWEMRYSSFKGTLPRITEILLNWEMALLVSVEPWVGCLFEAVIGVGTRGRTGVAEYLLEEFHFLEISRLTLLTQLRRGIIECPAWVTLSGSFTGERIAVHVILI
jgi:hypothetical protein